MSIGGKEIAYLTWRIHYFILNNVTSAVSDTGRHSKTPEYHIICILNITHFGLGRKGGAAACHEHQTEGWVQFSRSVMSDSLRPHESQHTRPPCPSPTPGVHSNSRPLSQWCHPAILSSVVPFSSCPQSLPASESFPVSQPFAWGGQSTRVSALASFLPKKSQGWSPLEWTGWISLQSKGLQESSPTPQLKSIHSLALSFLYSPTLTSIHDYCKNHSLDKTDLCWQSNVSAFEYAI